MASRALRPLSEETLGDMKLAVTEACTNSVRHGYQEGEGTVEILYELQPDRLVVEVADDGPGFDASGDRPTEDEPRRGRARDRHHQGASRTSSSRVSGVTGTALGFAS